MGKNFSNTKTAFEIQKEKMTEELQKIHNAINESLNNITTDMAIHKLALEILESFKEHPILICNKGISTEKAFEFIVGKYVNLSNLYKDYTEKIKSIPNDEKKRFTRDYLEEIVPVIIEKAKVYLNNVIQYMNNSISGYTFFLGNLEIKDYSLIEKNIYCNIKFFVDIK
ncbi:MAG: hypothetical protein E7311_01020 [Clostridiales bacterium]|nr:hypothetical protein [Clostridiales bacterium]